MASATLTQEVLLKSLQECTPEQKRAFEARFRAMVEPIYGCQDIQLEKIRLAKDRETYLIFDLDELVGLFIYKNELSSEYAEFGVRSSLEIKTLALFPEKKKARGLYAALMYAHIARKAMELGGDSIFITVSRDKKAEIAALAKAGFDSKAEFCGKVCSGATEMLLECTSLFLLQSNMQNYLARLSRKIK